MTTIPNFKDVWARYLFNEDANTVPKGDDLLDENLIRENLLEKSKTTGDYFKTLKEGSKFEISAVDFMNRHLDDPSKQPSPGGFVRGANFSVVKNFFTSDDTSGVLNTAKLQSIANNSNGVVKVDADGTMHFTLKQMADYGAIVVNGYSKLDPSNYVGKNGKLALIELENGNKPSSYYAGTQNFYVITRYNHSSYYAKSVIDLGEAVARKMH